MQKVVVLDYGSGNLRSAQRALERVGAEVDVTADTAAALDADGLVVPGVGAFAACMAGLDAIGAGPAIEARLRAMRPVLGICVGMQVLFTAGVEHGVESKGLGLLPGRVERLAAPILPHMGWNTVDVSAGSKLFAGMAADTRFYFVHSYAARHASGLISRATHGEPFVAAVEDGLVSATQFHPEKSGDAGAQLLENWLATL
ncbi:imidazole glycerol phosphate synthase subunit HisH [uncultured Jatrophihabitans sp.]|uniref:imidazole glycerol phosphate synthase subunit HisH n=1 Tax=uncultured Jatrophihabitans sp. TaxID=1610747 RepID=UPI0035CB86FF